MPDDRKPLVTPYPGKRASTHVGDRNDTNRSGLITPPRGVRIDPDEFDDGRQPITSVMAGEELREARARRPTAARLERLEDKHDETRRDVADLRASVGRVEGKLDVLPKLVEAVQANADRANQREQVTFTASVEVDKAQKIGDVEIKKAEHVGAVEARNTKLKLIGTVIVATAGVLELLHKVFG